MATTQFQTRHAQRMLRVNLVTAPLILAGFVGGGVVIDGNMSVGLAAGAAVVLAVAVIVFGARHRVNGLYVSAEEVFVEGPLGGGSGARMTAARPPVVGSRRWHNMDRIETEDADGHRSVVTWLVHTTSRTPWRGVAYGMPNELLERHPFSADAAERQWRPTGIVWTDDNGDEVVAYLQERVGQALAAGKQPG